MRFLAAAFAAAAFVAPPAPGPKGLEQVPVPNAPDLAQPQALKLNQSVMGVKCERSEKVAFHIHSHLAIFVNGKQKRVPYGIGIGPPLAGQNAKPSPFVTQGSCFSWLHTHTGDGIIHIEAPTKQQFTLGQFFGVWGQLLSGTQVGPAHGKVTAIVNGKVWTKSVPSIPLTNHALIQLDVGTPLVGQQKIGFGKL